MSKRRQLWTPQQQYCTACAILVLLGFMFLGFYLDPVGAERLNPFGGQECGSQEQTYSRHEQQNPQSNVPVSKRSKASAEPDTHDAAANTPYKQRSQDDYYACRLAVYTKQLALFTALIFVITVVIAVIGIYQGISLGRHARIAERALTELEHPLLHFVVDSTNWDEYSTWSAFFATEMPGHPVIPSIDYSKKNYGRTPAVITNILIGADYGRDAPPINVATEIHLPKDHVIPVNGTTDALQVEPMRNIPNDITEGRYDRQIIRFWCFGLIIY